MERDKQMSENKCPVCCEEAYINGPLFICRECPFTINAIELPIIAAAIEHKRKWDKDSSLETWFPYTEEELVRLRDDLARHNELREAVKKYLVVTDAADMAVIENTLTTEILQQVLDTRSEVDRLIAQAGEGEG